MNNFQSKDGITIAEVRTELQKQGAIIQRDKAYTCRRWIIDFKGNQYYIRYIPTMGEMLQELQTKKVLAFCKEYEAGTDGKTAKIRKETKLKKKEVRALKTKKKNNGPELVELSAQYWDAVVDAMALGIDKEEKLKRRAKRNAIAEKIIALGGSLEYNGKQKANQDMSKEELDKLVKINKEKKAQKKAAKQSTKNGNIILKPGRKKKITNVEDMLDGDYDTTDDVKPKKKSAKAKTVRKTALKKEKVKKKTVSKKTKKK